MTIRPRAPRLTMVAAALALVLVLAGCAGGTGGTGGTGGDAGGDTAGLPTSEDLGAGGGTDEPLAEDDAPRSDGDAPVTSGMCTAEEPDCQDMIVPGDGAPEDGDPAAGSCLAGDEDCTDESYGGQDVARPIPLTDRPSDAERIESGTTSGAAGRHVTGAYRVDGTTLELTFEGGACDLLEDVVVEESPDEVRVLVLSGMDASVDMCAQQIVQWSTEVTLDAPLGDRALLDLAG